MCNIQIFFSNMTFLLLLKYSLSPTSSELSSPVNILIYWLCAIYDSPPQATKPQPFSFSDFYFYFLTFFSLFLCIFFPTHHRTLIYMYTQLTLEFQV